MSGILAGVGNATIFGFSFLMTKSALDHLDPMELIFFRFLLAALAMTLLWGAGIARMDFRGKRLGALLLACLFHPVLYFILEAYGVRESATSTAGLIIGALPAVVAALGLLMLGERTSPAQSAGLALSIGGVALVVLAGSGEGAASGGTLKGALLLVASMLSAALFNVFSRKASKDFSDFERTFAMMWAGTLAFAFVLVARKLSGGSPAVPAGALGSLGSRVAAAWLPLAYLGILSSIVAFFLLNFTLSRMKASQAASFTNLVTLITVTAGVAIRGERFGAFQAVGAVMIVAGVWAANSRGKSDPARAVIES